MSCLLCFFSCCHCSSSEENNIKLCMDEDEDTAHGAMRTLAAQAEEDYMWENIVLDVAKSFGNKRRKKHVECSIGATRLLMLMDLLPLCDSQRVAAVSRKLLAFARDQADNTQLRNAFVIWNSLAGKFDVRVSGRMLTDDLLKLLMEHANHRHTTDTEVCLHALLTLERFTKTGKENARRISDVGYYERLQELALHSRDHKLKIVCEWGITHIIGKDSTGKRKRDRRRDDVGPATQKLREDKCGKYSPSMEMESYHQYSLESEETNQSDDEGGEESDREASAFSHCIDIKPVEGISDVIKLNVNDKTNFVKLTNDAYEARNDSSSFGSIRANAYVCSVNKEGKRYGETAKYYYEVTLRTGGIMQIGWATKDTTFKPEEGQGVGDDVFSYAYDGCRRLRWHSASSSAYGHKDHKWKEGDLVGCIYDAISRTVDFTLNGRAIDKQPAFVGVKGNMEFYPAVSLGAFQQCHFNFGQQPLRFMPKGCLSVHDFVRANRIVLESGKEDEATMGNSMTEHLGAEGELCTICYDEGADVQLLPCKHKDICYTCALRLVTCPVCRTTIESREQIMADLPCK